MADNTLYGDLYASMLSSDPHERDTAQRAAKNLTEDERKQFMAYQQQQTAGRAEHRVDADLPSMIAGGAATLGALNPGTVAAGASAVGRGVGQVLTHPAVDTTVGAYQGYKRGGVLGALEGAAAGYGGSKIFKAVNGLMGAAKAAAPAAEAAGPSLARLVLTPEEAAAQRQILQMAKQQASKVGMAHASGGSIRDSLLGLLGK